MRNGLFLIVATALLALAAIAYAPWPALATLGLIVLAGFLVVTDRA